MSTALAKRTWADIVNSVAWNFGQNLTARQAEDLLWGYTGFPCFWRGEPEASARKQLWDYFVAQSFGCLPCMRCGSDAASDMCEPCRSVVDAEIAVEAK